MFGELKRVYFGTIVETGTVSGMYFESTNGRTVRFNLRTIAIEGTAALLIALEKRDIEVETPKTRAADRQMKEIARARKKLEE